MSMVMSFWPALISKGLRHHVKDIKPELIKFLACPDFKGIKTVPGHMGNGTLTVSGLP